MKKKKYKKYSRGISAIEILCVIVELAVIIYISYALIIKPITISAKEKSFDIAVEAAANWFNKQYELSVSGIAAESSIVEPSEEFKNVCGPKGKKCLSDTDSKGIDATRAIKGSGLSEKDIDKMLVIINKYNKKTCIKLIIKKSSSYYTENKQEVISGNCNLNFIDNTDM